jgi:hypothetical protein
MTSVRRTTGFAVVTAFDRAAEIHQQLTNLSIPHRLLTVQNGQDWPSMRPPVVLNTTDFSLPMLVQLLAAPPHQSRLHRPSGQLITLVQAHRWGVLRLVRLCPAVALITDDMAALNLWRPHIADLQRGRTTSLWLVPPPPLVPTSLAVTPLAEQICRDPFVLQLLAILPTSPTYTHVAQTLGLSYNHLLRKLCALRQVFQIPTTRSPANLAEALLLRFDADSPGSTFCV